MPKPTHNYLITIPYGIGDVLYIGLSVVDQIIKNDPLAFGNIDFLCNHIQAELLTSDPRIIPIATERELFPTQFKSSWYKLFFITHPRARILLDYFKKRQYDAIFPGNAAFGFIHKIGTPVMYPQISSILKDFLDLRKYKNAQASRQVRRIVNNFFENKLPDSQINESIKLYVDESVVRDINRYAYKIKRKTDTQHLALITPDTTSKVTRLPTELLLSITEYIFKKYKNYGILLLPSYDSDATESLYSYIPKELQKRVIKIPPYPRWNLMSVVALTEIVDLIITGDTGIMHIAAAQKVVVDINRKKSNIKPKNQFNTIAIFGGTNPGLYGYPIQTIILGRGSSEQKKIRPGLLKEGYNPGNRDYFGHISIKNVINAIDKLIIS